MKKICVTAFVLGAGLAAPAAADCRFTLHFAFGSAALKRADSLLLHDLARAYPSGPMALSAHADDDALPAENVRIARARADAVVARLGRAGLAPGSITHVAPLAADWDAVPTRGSSSALNRRVDLFVGGCDARAYPQSRRVTGAGIAFTTDGGIAVLRPLDPGF